jgi:hypothetical protein
MWTETKTRGSLHTAGPRLVESPPDVARRPRPAERRAPRGGRLALNLAVILSIWFFITSVLKYFTITPDTYGIFWSRHQWLFAHIAGSTAALLLGPFQVRLEWGVRQPLLYRVLGLLYMTGVAAGSVTAFHLARNTDFGLVFGLGLGSMAFTWILTTGMAAVAACRKMTEQHQEWIVRSYVVTFSFVIYRILISLFDMTGTGTLSQQLTASSWLCWSIPLLLTEAVLQGRKVFARSPSNVRT